MNQPDPSAPTTRRLSSYANLLDVRIISATTDEVVAEMPVTSALLNGNGVLHGGAIMSLADHVGGTAAVINLPQGMATTTIESKTNFLRPIRLGDTAHATAIALHKGRKTGIWQTTIRRGDGKVAAIVTQTQMIMEWQDG